MSEQEVKEEQEIFATLVEIKQEPTELYKILKFESLVSGGGEAKQVISEGYVYLNGEVETRKRKKVYAGDLIYFNEQYLQIALAGQLGDYELVEPTQANELSSAANLDKEDKEDKEAKQKREKKETQAAPRKGIAKKTRKAINF